MADLVGDQGPDLLLTQTHSAWAVTDAGITRLDKTLGVWNANDLDSVTNAGRSLSAEQLGALWHIERTLEKVPGPVIPEIARQLDEMVQQEISIWELRQRPRAKRAAYVVKGIAIG